MIRRAFLGFSVALALTAWSAPAAAQAVAGTWLLDVTLDAGSGRASFVLQTQGNAITGTYSGVLGDQDVTGTIEGSNVTFGFESPDAGKVTFEGVIDGDKMEGTCEYGALGTGSFSGSRSR
ncbi:MAG: hypothetical protein FJ207_03075 [Gemmatimonadetes bacterium]|nr:hypothetical protein [Gemmatimonadota bacterium]